MSQKSGMPKHDSRRGPLLRAVSAFVISIAAAGAFLVFYWSDRGTAWLGGSLALAFAGVGAGMVFWAHGMMPDEEISEDRGDLPSSEEEIESFRESLAVGENKIARRRLLGWLLGIAAGLLVLGPVSLIRSLGKSPLPVLFQTVWQNGMMLVTPDGKPVSAADMPVGAVMTVFPAGQVNATASQTLLLRVDQAALKLPPERSGWAPGGFLAFSKICTHAGCPVAQFEKSINVLLCPCHQSAFDVLRGAVVVGGPAGRPLPQLPLKIGRDGILRAGGDFSGTPGPEFWNKA